MSYTLIDNAIFEDENLKHTEFRVLTYIIRNYNSELGYSFPTRKQITEKCKVNKDTLSSALNSLEEKGYITRETNPFKAGRNNIYYIHKYLFIPSNNEVVEEDHKEEIVNDIDEIAKDNEETNEIIKKFYTGEIAIEEQTKQDELNEKIEVFQQHLNRKISLNLISLIKCLEWTEIVSADMQINSRKKDKYVTESYIINAIYDNKKPNLKIV